MRLEVEERMVLIDLLSRKRGNYKDLHKLRRVRGMAGFDTEEYIRLKITEGPGGITFDRNEAESMSKEIPIDDWTFNYVVRNLEEMDKAGQLTDAFLPLYAKFIPVELEDLPTMDEETAAKMREERKGKKTVAIVGLSPNSCTLAPFKEDVELWSMNEAHHFSWFTRATRWFQPHNTYKREIANRGVKDHYKWLKKNEWNIPIYMIKAQPEIPKSVSYPLKEVRDRYLGKVTRGDEKVTYFNSSIDYMLALACYEGYERIELYGVDASATTEYEKQRPGVHFWIGVAIGQGIEVWLPEGSMLLKTNQYGGADQGPGWEI